MTDSYEFRQEVLARGRLIGVTEPCAEYIFVCDCHYHVSEQTAPTPKLDPETRPNVPPRMM